MQIVRPPRAKEAHVKTTIARLAALTFVAAAAVPAAARAETIGVRFGFEAPIYTRWAVTGATQSYTIGDTLQPAINVLLSYKPLPILSFDAEFREGFTHTGHSRQFGFSRTGTAIGPGITLSAPLIPIYVRGSLPIHVEPSPVIVGLRGAAGLELSFVIASLYLEAAVDTSLAGGSINNANGTSTPNVGTFDLTTVSLGTGIWIKF
jgi:hypothetical protein